MKVTLEKIYPVAASANAAWEFLQDIKAVASCMPGAEIIEQSDETHFKGMVKVKVGPAVAAFKGDIEVQGINTEKRELILLGKGADTKGTSSASMHLTASIRETENGQCELIGHSVITVNGKMASFGGRMMDAISERILQQFADNFANNVIAMGAGSAAEAAAVKVAEAPKELNGLALVWHLMTDFFNKLFGREPKRS
ncbi:MAG: SRPBCC family protein [Gammaproteobacteria bacterium]|nr:SRPBCC family protein [Gammaproteobacteria bacterium]MCZ6723783.1 SRPBCC family protein [Gammaproteobacteria bacterium]MCZ6796342.1 SRPBCC family protein [Gammaproteobacteria bacterium]